MATCSRCNGNGHIVQRCLVCHGSGVVNRGPKEGKERCSQCNGAATFQEQCTQCGGSGKTGK